MHLRACTLLVAALLPFAVQAEEVQPGTLTVQSEAVTKLAPDEVTLPVTISEENKDLKTAKEKHDQKLRVLLQLASDMNFAKDKIQTGYTSVSPQYDYVNSKQVLRGYQVETSVNFTLTDISKLGRFMDNVVASNIDRIGSVSYSLQNEEKIRQDTLVNAMALAHDKAERLATAAHMTLDKPLTITEGGAEIVRPFPPRPMMRAMALAGGGNMAAAAPPELPTGLIEVHQSVTVTYQIK